METVLLRKLPGSFTYIATTTRRGTGARRHGGDRGIDPSEGLALRSNRCQTTKARVTIEYDPEC